jgi:enterochelin esterase-like enzyme
LPEPNIRIYLLVGKYDLPVLKPMIYKLKTILKNKQYSVSFNEYPEGHNWVFWQKYLPDSLLYLFPNK